MPTSPILRKQLTVQPASLRTRRLRASIKPLLLACLLVRLSDSSMIGSLRPSCRTLSGYQHQHLSLHKRIMLFSHRLDVCSSNVFYIWSYWIWSSADVWNKADIYSSQSASSKIQLSHRSEYGYKYNTINFTGNKVRLFVPFYFKSWPTNNYALKWYHSSQKLQKCFNLKLSFLAEL